jgi:Sulfatase/alpha/beta hydrolase fold
MSIHFTRAAIGIGLLVIAVRRAGAGGDSPLAPMLREVLHMGIADAQQALRLARRNTAAWRIDPARVGIMGFSAGGGIAVGTSLAERSDGSPDFLVSLYGPSLQDVNVPAHAPPLFIAVGSSHFNVTNGCLALFAAWKAAGKPAEIHVYDHAPHWPYNRPDRPSPAPGSGAHVTASAENPPTRADYAAMLEAVDSGVGRILQTMARLGLTDNTIVIFTNDNGGEWLSNGGPLFNRKWTVWEGGIRVPAIVKWPGRIRAGSVSDQPAITFDWSASILAAAGVPVPASYEGINILPILEGRAPKQERTFVWRSAPNSNRTQQAVRQGDWKLVVDANHLFLYNLREDIGERHDRTSQRPDIVRRLRTLVDDWTRSVDAEAKGVK